MAEQLEPGRAETADVPDWLKLSYALILRRWRLYLGLVVLYFYIAAMTRYMGWLTLPLGYVIGLAFVFFGILAAKYSDESLTLPVQAVFSLLQKTVVKLLILAILISVVTFAAVALGTWLMSFWPVASGSSMTVTTEFLQRAVAWTAPGGIRFFIIVLSVTITGMWFLLPLLVFHQLTLLESALLSKRAERRNLMIILLVGYTPLFGVIILLLIHDIAYLLIVPLFPYFAALQYVAYRHIFLQRKQNSPARALATEFKTLPA